ncbi:uncharacterized protein LOC116033264 [Ipomoea triloba]|uniref:uncharacterized protein LOC116033264 n=1 Tax=Ipomoea triloba TaxID=35885 RepID=UPI00125E00CD|nr:uncharacterized protein LOC116033264 [Ipomoea triloba]
MTIEVAATASPVLRRARPERRPVSSRLRESAPARRPALSRLSGSGSRQPTEQGERPRLSALDRLDPPAKEARRSLQLPTASDADSSEASSSDSRRRRHQDPARSSGLSRGVLDKVRAEFNQWKQEHSDDRTAERATNLLRTPFTSELMSQSYPIDLRVPGDKEYAGRSDPEQHVNLYYGNMLMMGVSEAVMCRAFYSTLTGRAAEWFRTLEPGSISNFQDLARRFVDRFAMSKTVKKHFSHLENAKQLDGEPLSVFIERWNKEMAEIEPVDDVTATNLLFNSLRAGNLYQDLILRPPSCYEDTVRRVVAHATATEANSAKRMMETEGPRRDQSQRDRRPNNPRQKDRDGNSIYTPLTRPVAEVLQFAQNCHLIQLPAPARDGPDKDKYCAYHRNRGHDTEECHVLKGLIEDLLQTGELAQFAEKKKKNRRGGENTSRRIRIRKTRIPTRIESLRQPLKSRLFM